MTIGEYFEAHPEKRPDWLNRIYYGEYAKRYGMPITQEDTWALDALRPGEENLAAINALLAENGLPPLKSVDWPVVEDALLANMTENGIMKLYERSQPEAETGAEHEENVSTLDLLPLVTDPEQLADLRQRYNEILQMLTDEQKQRINSGVNLFDIMEELDPEKREAIEGFAPYILSVLNDQQQADFGFLASGILDGIDLNTRQAILQRLKDNGGEITLQELVELGVYSSEDGGLFGLQQKSFAKLVGTEYNNLKAFGISIAFVDQESRRLQDAQVVTLYAIMAAPLIEEMIFGRSGQNFGDNLHDIRERYGYVPPQEGSAAGAGQQVGVGETTLLDWTGKTEELAKTAPVKIPDNAIIKSGTKAAGYDQISYKWAEGGCIFEARWHTKTSGAPTGQGNTWVVTRVTPGTPTGQMRAEHILAGDNWVTRYEWQAAIDAYQKGTMTAAQETMLKAGHWLAP